VNIGAGDKPVRARMNYLQSLSQSDNHLNIQSEGSATRCTANTAVSLLSVQEVSSGFQGWDLKGRTEWRYPDLVFLHLVKSSI
jgi:hypothetical protein